MKKEKETHRNFFSFQPTKQMSSKQITNNSMRFLTFHTFHTP